ncbi:MAG: bifunctional 4-hydroxy-2-oxoglutarate aldolase/2-dehydro-3-deoxy-phosphogluconate aldolase [Anaerolineae bacterium]
MTAADFSSSPDLVIQQIGQTRIIPVCRLEEYGQVQSLARALQSGGIPIIELTLTGKGAFDAVSQIRAFFGSSVLIGVGTVLDTEAATSAIDAGAHFIVTPVYRPRVIDLCRERNVCVVSGAYTPTEAQDAYEAGADLIKIFPIRTLGAAFIKDLLGPLPHLRIVPTGGIHFENARSFIEAGALAVGMGREIISQELVTRGDWAAIQERAARAVQSVSAAQ